MESENTLHDRKRVKAVLTKARRPGGVAWSDAQTEQMTSWFRTLVMRGLTNYKLMSDGLSFKSAFEKTFPNRMTRCQYKRTYLAYLSGLTEEEFATEYPDLQRDYVVALLNDVTRIPKGPQSSQTPNAPQTQ